MKLNKTIKELKKCLQDEKNDSIQNYLENLTANEEMRIWWFRSPKREKSPRISHYHPRNSPYVEPKLEYPRSRNIDYISQEPEYGAHEEFGYRERKNNARM